MTELERIVWAMMFMEKLANGISPIEDTLAPAKFNIIQIFLSGGV